MFSYDGDDDEDEGDDGDDEDGDDDKDGDDDDKDFTSRASSHPSIVFTAAQYSGTPMAAADVEVCSKNRRFLHHSVLQKLFFLNRFLISGQLYFPIVSTAPYFWA